MIVWSEAKRAQDKGYFIRAAIEMYEGWWNDKTSTGITILVQISSSLKCQGYMIFSILSFPQSFTKAVYTFS